MKDFFQTLAQVRPCRISQTLEEILDYLKKRVDQDQLDRELVKLVNSESHVCYTVATGSEVD